MFAERNYSDGGYRGPMSMLNKLVIALVSVFVIQSIDIAYNGGQLTGWLKLSTDAVKRGFVWQFVTFNFLHAGFGHILINCLVLWMIGRVVEQSIGQKRFLTAFIATGITGGLLQFVLIWIFAKNPDQHSLVGASAGVAGIFAIFASMFKDEVIRVYFVLPVKAGTLLKVSVAIAGFFTLVPPGDSIAHAAHLGGLLAGMAFVKWGWHREFHVLPWEGWWAKFQRKQSFVKKTSAPVRSKGRVEKRSVNSSAAAPQKPVDVKRRVDQILDKISDKGLNSLTEEERDFLERARKKM
jgi:membrane associated rhomboid family serine protease